MGHLKSGDIKINCLTLKTNNKRHNYRELEIWNEGIELAKIVYQMTLEFPKEEIYGLTSQIRRCAVSIPSNIAEGCGRDSTKDFNHFLAIATGSSYELETQLILAKELGYISADKMAPVLQKLDVLQKKIYRFKQKINSYK